MDTIVTISVLYSTSPFHLFKAKSVLCMFILNVLSCVYCMFALFPTLVTQMFPDCNFPLVMLARVSGGCSPVTTGLLQGLESLLIQECTKLYSYTLPEMSFVYLDTFIFLFKKPLEPLGVCLGIQRMSAVNESPVRYTMGLSAKITDRCIASKVILIFPHESGC